MKLLPMRKLLSDEIYAIWESKQSLQQFFFSKTFDVLIIFRGKKLREMGNWTRKGASKTSLKFLWLKN